MIEGGNMPSEEELAEIRRRRMAILKASNQMLREAEEKALSKTNDKIRQLELKRQFEQALDENVKKAKSMLNATMDEVESAEYREADKIYVEKYNKRLEKKGLTDEQLHMKETATFSTSKNDDTKKRQINRRPRKGAKKDLGDDYVPLDNEEELMKQTMVTDDKQIEENIRKNDEFMNERRRRRNNKVENLKDEIKESVIEGKVQALKPEDMGRVEVKNKPKTDGILYENVKKNTNENVEKAEVREKPKKKKSTEFVKYDFDFSGIPSYVQYDVIPLPSNGQCYPITSPLRCGRIPVAYLTAADENIITSPNAYRDGKLFDLILGRKILDKRINPSELCSGDRDAIILWLRATSYGEDFPIMATHPDTGKRYDITIKLSQFDYNDFDLEGDENGLFDYETNNGDKIKFKFFTSDDEEELRNKITSQLTDGDKLDAFKTLNALKRVLERIMFEKEDKKMIDEDIDEIKEILGEDIDENEEDVYPNVVTEQMVMHTISVNGNEDREYIKNYIENMRTKTAMDYRNYFVKNKPGVDFNFNVNIPESDGGGSFSTFLRLNDSVFINI